MNEVDALSKFTLQDFKLATNYESYLKEEYSTDSLVLEYYKDFCSYRGVNGEEVGRIYLFNP